MSTINDIINHVELMTHHTIIRDEGVHFGPIERDIASANDPSICCRFGQ
jgi:hypothetical protein